MESRSNGNGYHPERPIGYERVRKAARSLMVFTPEDLADELETTPERAEQFIGVLAWQGLLLPQVDWNDDGFGLPEPIYTMEPLPSTVFPRNRYTPPEIEAVMQTGGLLLYDLRGVAVRIRTERDMRKSMSTPGARQRHKNAEREYQRARHARLLAAEIARKKQVAKSQGKKYEE